MTAGSARKTLAYPRAEAFKIVLSSSRRTRWTSSSVRTPLTLKIVPTFDLSGRYDLPPSYESESRNLFDNRIAFVAISRRAWQHSEFSSQSAVSCSGLKRPSVWANQRSAWLHHHRGRIRHKTYEVDDLAVRSGVRDLIANESFHSSKKLRPSRRRNHSSSTCTLYCRTFDLAGTYLERQGNKREPKC